MGLQNCEISCRKYSSGLEAVRKLSALINVKPCTLVNGRNGRDTKGCNQGATLLCFGSLSVNWGQYYFPISQECCEDK